MKVRIAYTKTASAQYIAHLDMTRLFQRAFRRAAVDIVYSEGFNPHARISFGAPLPVGMAGDREYVDVEIKDMVLEDMQKAFARLSKQMPSGISLLSWQILPPGVPKLMALLDTAVYRAEVPWQQGPFQTEPKEAAERRSGDAAFLAQALRRWLEKPQILWQRHKKGQSVTVDIRPFIRSVTLSGLRPLPGKGNGTDNGVLMMKEYIEQIEQIERVECTAVFEIITVLGNAGSVRPLEILGAFCRDEEVEFDLERARVRRTGVYWLDAGGNRRAPDEF